MTRRKIQQNHGIVIPRAASLPVHREDWHGITRNGWQQPGRSFGPSPLGPEHPKANKVTDTDGNSRIMPLTADQRISRYYKGSGYRHGGVDPDPDAGEREPSPRRRAALLGLTLRQTKRLRKKANHASAYGDRVRSRRAHGKGN